MPRALILVVSLLAAVWTQAQTVQLLRPHDMAKWGVPAGNYSGIAPLGDGRYALVSDKQTADGWHEVSIAFDPAGADVQRVEYVAPHLAPPSSQVRDAEGVVAVPVAGEGTTGSAPKYTLFICAEDDQQVVEVDADGRSTGRQLHVPAWSGAEHIFGNYGFEALAYDAGRGDFWTTTEQGLRGDVQQPSAPDHPAPALLRLQRYDRQLQYVASYAYRTDAPGEKKAARSYAFGVPAMTVLNDSTLLVLEREVVVKPRFNRSYVRHRLYAVQPHKGKACSADVALSALSEADFLPKRLIGAFTTRLRLLGRKDMANYEGMCLGPRLADGRQTLLFVADSQNRAGNSLFHLKDYIRVGIINP